MAQAIVGLGNPGPEYRATRHNIGQRVVEGLGRTLHARFTRDGGHLVARARWRGEALCLVKPQCFMNVSGPAVARLGRKLGLDPSDLIVVFDDLDLPLGKIRVRMKGSAGGHNGVRSLIEALGTTEFRRIKIGIGRPGAPGEDRGHVVDHVLSPFYREEQEAVEAACAEAAQQALKLVESRPSLSRG
ncbi:MAG: aminoacyl-tRNA hydrolase [Candidatus Rokubacteria bacterium RIFCSPLOWO2_12_FULL_71_19]|nr:MAG: aminoacyl-tRNA hydrolase [Candidatus Rokubacteria bacterium RIFCSPLOWO2_12_FULL_71_19]